MAGAQARKTDSNTGIMILHNLCGYVLHVGRCRTHHKIKQEPGWTLRQPRPGYFEITTPAGRTYTTEPDTYPT